LAKALFVFALLYGVYALGCFPLPPSARTEVTALYKRVPQSPLFWPLRAAVWLVLLPMHSLFPALGVAFIAACLSWLLLAFG